MYSGMGLTVAEAHTAEKQPSQSSPEQAGCVYFVFVDSGSYVCCGLSVGPFWGPFVPDAAEQDSRPCGSGCECPVAQGRLSPAGLEGRTVP